MLMPRFFAFKFVVALVTVRIACAESVLTLPIPGDGDHPKKAIRLQIRVPQKLVPEPEPPIKETYSTGALRGWSKERIKKIPQKKFVFETLRMLRDKGLVQREFDRSSLIYELDIYTFMTETVLRVDKKLEDVWRNKALRKFGLTISDIERFQRVWDIFRPGLMLLSVPVTQADKNMDAMIDLLKMSSGRGAIRVMAVKENEDGSTLLELEVQRHNPHLDPY